jgi:hypothetical protein
LEAATISRIIMLYWLGVILPVGVVVAWTAAVVLGLGLVSLLRINAISSFFVFTVCFLMLISLKSVVNSEQAFILLGCAWVAASTGIFASFFQFFRVQTVPKLRVRWIY